MVSWTASKQPGIFLPKGVNMNAPRLKALIEAYNHGTEQERNLVLNGTAVFKIINGEPTLTFYMPGIKGVYETRTKRWIGVFERR